MSNPQLFENKSIPRIEDYRRRLPARSDLQAGAQPTSKASSSPALVTIITPTYNSAKTLARTIDSVRRQDHPAIEYIVIDGGSSDSTLRLLEARRGEIDLLLTEPDRGISDAFNKGIALASGRYIALVNSDDWLEPTHISTAVRTLEATAADFVFGALTFHAVDGAPLYMLHGEKDYGRRISHSMPHINHPTVVCRREVYEEQGLFNIDCSTAMDYEWLLRGYRRGVRGVYDPNLMSHMSVAGVSDRDFARGMKEVCRISIQYGYPPLLAWSRYWIRYTKTRGRHAIAGWMPSKLYKWLRGKINSHYRAITNSDNF